jgi:two-component system sensor histidine kinase GlrK
MKIASKISAGYGFLIALIVAVLVYQLSLFYQMQSINQDLSGINFRAAILSLQLLRDLDQVEEFTRKFFVTEGDPDYAAQMEEMRDALFQGLEELESLRLSPVEKQEVDRLSHLWSEFSKTSEEQQREVHSMSLPEMESALSGQLAQVSALRIEAQTVIRATRLAIESRVQESSLAGQHAQRISWIAAAVALLSSLIVSFWIIRSISDPLRHLTEGTRAVAAGQFLYQLDSSGKDELAQLAGDFNIMTRRLGELDEMKKDFVSHVSHELKTPLASMQEAVRLLLEELPGPINAQQKRFLELNLQSGKRLSLLIGNLLDLSRIEAGVMQYDMQKHDLTALIRTVLAEFELPLREKGLQLEVYLPEQTVMVECDGDRIIQVLGNLLGNALKFSPRDSALKVSMNPLTQMPLNVPPFWLDRLSTSNSEGFALISVADSGPGLAAGEKEKIFEKFHQVRREGKNPGQGAGLGLAIGRTIVEAHNGAIWVDDNPGGGSVFYVLLGAGRVREPAAVRTSLPI